MAKKKLNLENSPMIKDLEAKTEASRRGELDTSKLNGVILEDATPPAGVTLAPVTMFAVTNLKDHPLNKKFFQELPPAEYEKLKEDIQGRGVLVPVIATAEGVILSGHRRVAITRELGRVFIPVQFIKGTLTPAQEREFLIKDNLLRRHLGPAEKKTLIIALYGDEIDKDRRGGDRKSAAAKIKSEDFTFDRPAEPLPERIERETGGAIKRDSAKRTIAEIRKDRQGAADKPGKPSPASDPLKAVRSHLGKIVKMLDGADQKTIDAAIIEIVQTLDEIGIDGRYSNQVKEIIQNMRA